MRNLNAIKATNKYLHDNKMAFIKKVQIYNVKENVVNEASILKQLSKDKDAPKSFLEYYGLYEWYLFCLHRVLNVIFFLLSI